MAVRIPFGAVERAAARASVKPAGMRQIAEEHCQDCGRSGYEAEASDGYSGCCNERMTGGWPGDKCEHYDNGGDCFHA